MDFRICRIGLLGISLLAIVVGMITGIGAVVFRALIGFIHNLFFLGRSRSPTTPISSPRQGPGEP